MAGNTEPSLNFRFTARDLAPEGGGYAYGDVKLLLDKTSGPFRVTSKAAATAAAVGGRTETIYWTNNTSALSANVRISLSMDGGQTFPTVLAESTPNDGNAQVTWPDVATTKARIKVEAVENYFFDVNDADITILSDNDGSTTGPTPTTPPTTPPTTTPTPTTPPADKVALADLDQDGQAGRGEDPRQAAGHRAGQGGRPVRQGQDHGEGRREVDVLDEDAQRPGTEQRAAAALRPHRQGQGRRPLPR